MINRILHSCSCIIEFIKLIRQSLTSYLFPPTCLINSIINEHSCKILYLNWNCDLQQDILLSQLSNFVTTYEVIQRVLLLQLSEFCCCYCPSKCLCTLNRCIQGLSGKFVDMACFHSFLYIFQISLTYYDSLTPEWIKYKAEIVLSHKYT